MKTYCKNINLEDREFISKAVYKCAHANGRWRRGDFLVMVSRYAPYNHRQLKKMIQKDGFECLVPYIELIIDEILEEIKSGKINLLPIWYKQRIDGASGKIREIGIEDMKQQLYDYIAVDALMDIFKRIGEFQCASIKGRGQSYGAKAIQKWLENPKMKYCAKSDIKKCYESIDTSKLIKFLDLHIKNKQIIWLVDSLVNTYKKGLSIGSYLSQFLCNLYLSQLYHYISEDLYRIRKGRNRPNKRVRLIDHVLFFMDDIIILGTNKKDIHKAMKCIMNKVDELGLQIKSSWRVFECNQDRHYGAEFIDMMGFRFYHSHTTIRRRNFKHIRALYLKIDKMRKCHQSIPLHLMRKVIAYGGPISMTNSFKIRKKYHVDSINYLCRRAISSADKIFYKASSAIYCN